MSDPLSPRHDAVEKARAAIMTCLVDTVERHDLSYAELIGLLGYAIGMYAGEVIAIEDGRKICERT